MSSPSGVGGVGASCSGTSGAVAVRGERSRGGGGGGGQSSARNGPSRGGSHSSHLCPLLRAIADTLDGGNRSTDGIYSYSLISQRAKMIGFLWDEMIAAYSRDFSARGISIAHFVFDGKGHTPGRQQEVLLFPPHSAFTDSKLGRSSIPDEAFALLILWISQERHTGNSHGANSTTTGGGAIVELPLDCIEAARVALESFMPIDAVQEPLPQQQGPRSRGGGGGGGNALAGGGSTTLSGT